MNYHVTNTNNPVDFPKVKYVHIVYVHPLELGRPNLYKVNYEQEFDTKEKAEYFVGLYNILTGIGIGEQAVYYGCVNDETGELV